MTEARRTLLRVKTSELLERTRKNGRALTLQETHDLEVEARRILKEFEQAYQQGMMFATEETKE